MDTSKVRDASGHPATTALKPWPPKLHLPRGASPAGLADLGQLEGIFLMAAMKPRTGDGPMEVTKEGRSLIMRVPLEGGGRLVVELNAAEAANLKECLVGVTE